MLTYIAVSNTPTSTSAIIWLLCVLREIKSVELVRSLQLIFAYNESSSRNWLKKFNKDKCNEDIINEVSFKAKFEFGDSGKSANFDLARFEKSLGIIQAYPP